MEIYKPTSGFDFQNVILETPQVLHDGSFLTKIKKSDKQIYIQMPKCLTKDGFNYNKKGKFCDLLYTKDIEQNQELISWLLSLEEDCQQKIYDKRNIWFNNDLTINDIESLMIPITRLFKSGKEILLRTYIDVSKQNGRDKCLVYGEDEIQIGLDDISRDTFIIPLLLVEGIKFTPKSFEILFKITQIMALDDDKDILKDNCLIKQDDSKPLEVSVKTLAKNNEKNETKDIKNKIVESNKNKKDSHEKELIVVEESVNQKLLQQEEIIEQEQVVEQEHHLPT